MKKYTVDAWEEPLHDWTENKELNPYITETAGFKPLEVQIQEFEQAGTRARYRAEMYDSQDYRDMYLGPDTRILSSDDYETVDRKLKLQEEMRIAIANRFAAENEGQSDAASTAKQGNIRPESSATNPPAAGAE